jgi:metal-responsive CopG/Arc/MetJ family transcriptional regulator
VNPGGRPPIGPAINMRFPEDLLAEIDAAAEAEGIKRAEMIRRLAREALDARAASA